MASPYQILDWYGDRHTCHTASGALVRYRIRGFIHYRYRTSSKQQYGTVSRFQSAIGTVPWLQDFKFLGELDWPVLSDRRREARLSLFSKAAGGHSAISLMQSISAYETIRQTRRTDHTSFIPISARTDVYKYSFFPRTLLDGNTLSAECWSPSQVLVVCKRVSWSGRLSHDTPAVKGNAHCWIFADELKIQPKMHWNRPTVR